MTIGESQIVRVSDKTTLLNMPLNKNKSTVASICQYSVVVMVGAKRGLNRSAISLFADLGIIKRHKALIIPTTLAIWGPEDLIRIDTSVLANDPRALLDSQWAPVFCILHLLLFINVNFFIAGDYRKLIKSALFIVFGDCAQIHTAFVVI